MITNGYLLVADRIERLNRAGLEYLQISIDNVHAGRRLEEEPEGARPETGAAGRARRVSREHQFGARQRRARSRGRADAWRTARWSWDSPPRSGFIHDGNGQLQPLGTREREIFEEIMSLGKAVVHARESVPAQYRRRPRERVALPRRRRAISTSARTAWCTTARSSAAIPAFRSRSTRAEHRHREFLTKKSCAPRCTVSCVHQVPMSIIGAPRRRWPMEIPRGGIRWCS